MTLNEKIDLLVVQANKKILVDPYKTLTLLEALDKTLDAAYILMLLIEAEGELE